MPSNGEEEVTAELKEVSNPVPHNEEQSGQTPTSQVSIIISFDEWNLQFLCNENMPLLS